MSDANPELKDLPKVGSDLKSELQQFDHGKLHHAEPVEKNSLPSKEAIELEKKAEELKASIEGFDTSKLKHRETEEKNPLPTQQDIEKEKSGA